MEYYSAIKQNEIIPFAAAWMDLEITMLSEECWTEKDKYNLKWDLKCNTNELIYQTQTDS